MTILQEIRDILRPYGDYSIYMDNDSKYLRAEFPKIEQQLFGMRVQDLTRISELEAKVKAYEAIIENSNFKAAVGKKAEK